MRPKYLNTTDITSSTHLDTSTGNAIIRLQVSAAQQENDAWYNFRWNNFDIINF